MRMPGRKISLMLGGHDLVALLDICLFLDMVKSQPSILVKRQVAGYITGIAGPQGHAADVAVIIDDRADKGYGLPRHRLQYRPVRHLP